MTSNRCPVCGDMNLDVLAPYQGHSTLFENRNLLACSNCKLVFVDPMPSEDMLLEYNRTYFESAHNGLPTSPDALAFFSGIARLRLRHIQAYLNARDIGFSSVLEIGPGLGSLCKLIMDNHPDTDYAVVETDPSCRVALQAVGARVFERMDQLDPATNRFDLLILSHVLEHAPDPAAFLKPAIELLNPGGVVFIEVPCRDHEHKPVFEPHLLFFDKASMQHLLSELKLIDLQLTYHGLDLERAKRYNSMAATTLRRVRRLISKLGFPADPIPEIEGIDDPAERAAIGPLEPHLEKSQPSWWLRALTRKA